MDYDLLARFTTMFRTAIRTNAFESYCAEPVFVNLSRSPGIDSQPRGPVARPVRQPYRTGLARLHRLAESVTRFLGSLNVYKYGF
jgi:hypothetical protein